MKKLLPKSLKNPQGFTLVELMVVIAIIAVLTVIGITVFTNGQKAARDARRKADIESISSAMEQHYNPQPGLVCVGATNGVAGQYCALDASFFSSGQYPTDPLNGNATGCNAAICKYCVKAAVGACAAADATVGAAQPPAGATYVVCANLETAAGGPGGQNYICASNQQK